MEKIRKVSAGRRKVLATKKQIEKQIKRLGLQGALIDKLVKFFDGITINPVRGVILTPKKKRQWAEIRKLEQKLLKSQRKKPRN